MRRSKLYSIILSMIVAFGLWFYVVTNVSKEDEVTFYNIPVVMEGESMLSERNMLLTGISTNTVSLRLSGAREDLNKVDASNITVKVNLARIYEPGERLAMNYDIYYPGDVPSNAFVVESKNPGSIYVDVEYRRIKDIPVEVRYVGTRSEKLIYDTESTTLDTNLVTIMGPASVADQIAKAVVEVDLTERTESISETFRYTLCDAAGEPVDAAMITTNLEEVQLTMPIEQIKIVSFEVDVIHGGGTKNENTIIAFEPAQIRISGSEAVLEEFGDTYSLGTINLAEIESDSERSYTITLPRGITNQTGVSEVRVLVAFTGLKTREFNLSNIRMVNIPEGMAAYLISANLTVKVRGPVDEVDKLTEEDILATVDFTDAEPGNATYRPHISFADGFRNVGALKTGTISATVQIAPPETTEE